MVGRSQAILAREFPDMNQSSQMIEIHRFRPVYRISTPTRKQHYDIEVAPERIADDVGIRTSPDIDAGGRYEAQ